MSAEMHNWEDIAQDFQGADILLGNGFSLNLTGSFKYTSLFTEFLKNCLPEYQEIFTKFGTNNFEAIINKLRDARYINKLFKIRTNNEIEDAIECLKTGLLLAIKSNHPRSDAIDHEQLKRIAVQFNRFNDIFTLNYDLFLYHLIMHTLDKSKKDNTIVAYSDYFWEFCNYDKQLKIFMNYQNYKYKRVYYLHGALFIFENPIDTVKLIKANESIELIDLIEKEILEGRLPLFVSEGKPEDKIEAIKHNSYLTFAKENLARARESLINFGTSLSAPDYNIVNAINHNNNKRNLAISIYTGKQSPDNSKEEVERFQNIFKSHKIKFFNSETIFKF